MPAALGPSPGVKPLPDLLLLPSCSLHIPQAAIHECLASSLCVLANAALLPVNGSAQVQRSLSKLLDMVRCHFTPGCLRSQGFP